VTSPAMLNDAASIGGADPILRVDGLILRFGGVTSLAGVTFAQSRGEILAVIGPNGAGKTSLFNCLTGVYEPQAGSIHLFTDAGEVNLVGKKPHRINRLGIARTFQTSRLFGALTAFENVKIGVESRQHTGPIGAMLHLPRSRHEERASDAISAELLSFVGLERRANEIAATLPYGDQRRLEIARALGTAPQLLLLDEPAAGTNPSEKAELGELIEHVNSERGVSVLLIEHDMRLVMSIARRIVVLNFGEVIAEGAPREIQANPTVVEAYLGTSAEDASPDSTSE
jgi:branched-chain amino acid transport system ATP-binding protein